MRMRKYSPFLRRLFEIPLAVVAYGHAELFRAAQPFRHMQNVELNVVDDGRALAPLPAAERNICGLFRARRLIVLENELPIA
ncbi:hypothetical protein D3C74_363130 [compost metagenome]